MNWLLTLLKVMWGAFVFLLKQKGFEEAWEEKRKQGVKRQLEIDYKRKRILEKYKAKKAAAPADWPADSNGVPVKKDTDGV